MPYHAPASGDLSWSGLIFLLIGPRAGRHYTEVMSYETRHAIERIFGVEMKRLGYYWQPTSPSRCR